MVNLLKTKKLCYGKFFDYVLTSIAVLLFYFLYNHVYKLSPEPFCLWQNLFLPKSLPKASLKLMSSTSDKSSITPLAITTSFFSHSSVDFVVGHW